MAVEIMDGKLVLTGIDYDNYRPLSVFDLDAEERLFDGFGGDLVPIGPHELYFCSPGGWEPHEDLFVAIDTRTLARRPVGRLPCPNKVGRLLPHPETGHFIYAWIPLG